MIQEFFEGECYNEAKKNIFYKKIHTTRTKYSCSTATFNSNSTILFVGAHSRKIQIFGFNTKGKFIQKLYHSKACDGLPVTFFNMDEQNLLINIRELLFNKYQDMAYFSAYLIQMILNENEDLLVLFFKNGDVQFWKKELQAWNCLQILKTNIPNYGLYINKSQENLILLQMQGRKLTFLIIKLKSDKKLNIPEIINVDSDESLQLINCSQFAYILCNKNILEIFDYCPITNKIIKTKQVQLEANYMDQQLFIPYTSQILKQRKLLLTKHGIQANLFGMDKAGDLILQHQIQFGENIQFTLSNDEQHLFIWDNDSNNIGRPTLYTINKLRKFQIGKILYLND